MTCGLYRFIWAILGTSVFAAMIACVAVLRLLQVAPDGALSMGMAYWALLAGGFGGAAGFWLSYERWFGHDGLTGWIAAVFGAVVVSAVGSVIGGTLIFPLYGTMFAPLQLVMTMIANPVLAVLWLGMMLYAHWLLAAWRRERDSIFVGGYHPQE